MSEKLSDIDRLKLEVAWLCNVVSWLMSSGITQMTGFYNFPQYPKQLTEKPKKKRAK